MGTEIKFCFSLHIKHCSQIPTPLPNKVQKLYLVFKDLPRSGTSSTPATAHRDSFEVSGHKESWTFSPPPEFSMPPTPHSIQCPNNSCIPLAAKARIIWDCSPSWYLSRRFFSPYFYHGYKWLLHKTGLNQIVLNRLLTPRPSSTFTNELQYSEICNKSNHNHLCLLNTNWVSTGADAFYPLVQISFTENLEVTAISLHF